MKRKILYKICTLLLVVGAFSFYLPAQSGEGSGENKVLEINNKKRPSIGWQKTLTTRVTTNFGNIQLEAKSNTGTFNIFMRKKNGIYKSLFSTKNEYSSTYFVLMVGKKMYKLDSSCEVYVKKTDTGIIIVYKINNVAVVSINFDCIKSTSKSDYDIVKITSEIENLSKNTKEMALKLIMDTDLGEKTDVHFYTANNPSVQNESLYRTMTNEKWIVSKNEDISMQILLYGYDITTPESVSVANMKTLESSDWEPPINMYKSFDVLMSYNNSGVCINWQKQLYEKDSEKKFVFYIALANDDVINGYQYIQNHKSGAVVVEEPVSQNESFTPTQIPTPVVTTTVVKNPKVISEPQIQTQQPVESVPAQVEAEIPEEPAPVKMPEVKVTNTTASTFVPNANVKFDVETISKDHLTPEYIQNLIERINNLEDSGEFVDRAEILMLNSELDAILELLRQ